MTLRTCACVVLVMFVTIPLAAQDKPDFSGSWILESAQQPGGDIPNALTVSQSMNGSFELFEPLRQAARLG